MMKLSGLLLCMVLLLSSTSLAADGKGMSPFISIFSCDEANPKDVDEEVCLIAELKEGQAVYLLSDDVVCQVEAQEPAMLEREVGSEFMMTPVDVGDCDAADYYIAWRGKEPKSFQSLEFTQESSAKLRAQVAAAVRKEHLTAGMISAFEGTLKPEPILYKPFAKRSDIFLVQYVTSRPLEEDDLYGPLFWYAKGRVQLIDTQASIAAFFRLQGAHYIVLRHGCWEGCGEVGEKVLAISEKGASLIHHDTSFSD
jgi:hypothetical protein